MKKKKEIQERLKKYVEDYNNTKHEYYNSKIAKAKIRELEWVLQKR